MNTKRKVEDYIEKKVAVECSSEKEWELLLKLTSSERKNHFNASFNKCFDLENLGDFWSISSKEDIMENGWTVYPASDFLEEDKPFNVGDLVYLEKQLLKKLKLLKLLEKQLSKCILLTKVNLKLK